MKTHILLVDDEIEEMKILAEALKDVLGDHKCTHAFSGVHALEILHYLKPQFIFLDFNMPIMNGLELALAIRDLSDLKDTPVFLYAKHFDAEVFQKAKTAGIAGCLEKPATIAQFSLLLKSVFTTMAFAPG